MHLFVVVLVPDVKVSRSQQHRLMQIPFTPFAHVSRYLGS